MTKEQLTEELMCITLSLRAAQAWILMDEGSLPSRDAVIHNLARMLMAGHPKLYALMDDDECEWILDHLRKRKGGKADACE